MLTRRTLVLSVIAVAGVVVLSGCAAAAPDAAVSAAAAQPAGFWLGLWHGLICPITFLVSLFNSHVGIYEVHNSGGWYDFGFVLGVSVSFGGSSHSGRARGRRNRRTASAGVGSPDGGIS